MTQGTISDIVLLFGINAIMVVGFQAFVGNTGIVSFGHVAFMALGAYAAGILSVPITLRVIELPALPAVLAQTELDIPLTLVLGGVAAALGALVAGIAILRLSGAAASIATLGLLVIVNNLLVQAHSITRGPQSLYGVAQSTTDGWVFGSLIVVVALSALLKWSPWGLRARAVRDDPVAAEASGVRRLPARLIPFIFSAFVTGVGGALYAQDLTAFSPDSFFVAQIVGVLVMAIIGGLGSISGALIGASAISILTELLRHFESGVAFGPLHVQAPAGISELVLGLLLIGTLRWRPEGILGRHELEVDPRALASARARKDGGGAQPSSSVPSTPARSTEPDDAPPGGKP
jgi:branched-chain amino acid transport system permease protein